MPYTTITGISISGYLDTHLGHAGEAFAENLIKLLQQIAPDAPTGGEWEIREYASDVFALILPLSASTTLHAPQGITLTASVEAATLIANILLLNATRHQAPPLMGEKLLAHLEAAHPEASTLLSYLRAAPLA